MDVETLDLVEKLKKRLEDATSNASKQQEETITKILKRLSLLPMSIEILKVGKQVNGLRKWGGKVSSRAKALVKKWKQLLPESEESQETLLAGGASAGLELRTGNDGHISGNRRGHTQMSVPVIQIESGDSEGSVVDITRTMGAHLNKTCHKEKERKHKRRSSQEHREKESFSRALEMPSSHKVSGSGQSNREHVEDRHHHVNPNASSLRRIELGDVVFTGTSHNHEPATVRKGTRDKSPASAQRDATIGVKRKEPQQEVVIAQSKRSRTQVYSGRRVHTGPQVVTSLFDMCMKILIDNIDVIEEVGAGVPYHVLEPLLQRCSATQLLKLEEFNPHLIEDTEELWKKHVIKDFKVIKLSLGEAWRDLYREKLAEREEKLRNLTARIKANSHAREEPVRKVILADVTAKPGRRSGFRRGGFSRPLERPCPGTEMMKRTMKMAKKRNHMMTFKHKK